MAPVAASGQALVDHPLQGLDSFGAERFFESVRAIVGQDAEVRGEVGLTLVRTVGLCPPGTFVRLDNGETAIVLRRGERANFPLVASVVDAKGEPQSEPRLYHTERGQQRIQAALARSAVTVELPYRTMVRLGLYAAQRSASVSG